MLILILIDIQYLQNVYLDLEKVRIVKITPRQISITRRKNSPSKIFHFGGGGTGGFPPPLNATCKIPFRNSNLKFIQCVRERCMCSGLSVPNPEYIWGYCLLVLL